MLHRKLTAASVICLIFATTLAWGSTFSTPPKALTQAAVEIANTNNGSFQPLNTPFDKSTLKNLSVMLDHFNDYLESTGQSAELNTFFTQHKNAAFPSSTAITRLLNRMKEHGYRGNYNDVHELLTKIWDKRGDAAKLISTKGSHYAIHQLAVAFYDVSQASVLPRRGQTTFPFAALILNPMGLAAGMFFELPVCAVFDSAFAFLGLVGALTSEIGFGIAMIIVSGSYAIIRPWMNCG